MICRSRYEHQSDTPRCDPYNCCAQQVRGDQYFWDPSEVLNISNRALGKCYQGKDVYFSCNEI